MPGTKTHPVSGRVVKEERTVGKEKEEEIQGSSAQDNTELSKECREGERVLLPPQIDKGEEEDTPLLGSSPILKQKKNKT